MALIPWPHSVGWGSGVAASCGVAHQCGWDPVLLWLWCRPAAVAPIWPLAWTSICFRYSPRKKKIICLCVCFSHEVRASQPWHDWHFVLDDSLLRWRELFHLPCKMFSNVSLDASSSVPVSKNVPMHAKCVLETQSTLGKNRATTTGLVIGDGPPSLLNSQCFQNTWVPSENSIDAWYTEDF